MVQIHKCEAALSILTGWICCQPRQETGREQEVVSGPQKNMVTWFLSTTASPLIYKFTVGLFFVSCWSTDRGQFTFMLFPLLSSAAWSAWARWGLRAPGWPWLGISSPAAPPPPSGPQSTGSLAGRRRPGSAGCCSCRLRTWCCRPPGERHQNTWTNHNTLGWVQLRSASDRPLLLLTFPLYHTVSLPSGSISSVSSER